MEQLVQDALSQARLDAALRAEGVNVDQEVLTKVFRRLANPAGCEKCGSPTKVGTVDAKGVVKLACCGTRKK